MIKNEMNYPIHLGVTEAGEGEDGRIKSANPCNFKGLQTVAPFPNFLKLPEKNKFQINLLNLRMLEQINS